MEAWRKLKIQQRDIWKVKLSYTEDDTKGHEMKFNHPCIVVKCNPNSHMSTAIPLTSNLNSNNLPFTTIIRKTKGNGLTKDSVASVFQLRSLSHKRFFEKYGRLGLKDFETIKTIIKEYLEL